MAVQAIKVGEKIQDSAEYYRELKTSEGTTLSLASLAGKLLVLFFYPKAATPGCTKQACKFRDEYETFQKAGALVYGISSDSPEDNKAFATAQRLPFPLLTDPSSTLRKTLGIKGRHTLVFDGEGKCVMSFNEQPNAEQHAEDVIAALKDLPYHVFPIRSY
jgi:peroxiredoxin Q/BCP